MRKYSDEIMTVIAEILEDDNTETGGTSYANETVSQFLNDIADEDLPTTIDELDIILKECGIRPLTRYDIYKVEVENNDICFCEFPDEVINEYINNGLDCELYYYDSDISLDKYTDEELEEINWEFIGSYHA